MRAIYTTAIFLGAFLLFFVQPMLAKMILPRLGGTPAVWNTCAVFFQTALLAGYVYAHVSIKWLGVRRQSAFHLIVVTVAALTLPLGMPLGWSPPSETNPVASLLWLLMSTVGPVFLVISATGPLLQKWFSATSDPAAGDPYFLYAASNSGSMLALAAYPSLAEPFLTTSEQSQHWSIGYWMLLGALAACAWFVWSAASVPSTALVRLDDDSMQEVIGWRRRIRWIVLAFVPSSLTIGATTYITTDVASVPLFWVIPLAIYLLSFTFAFSRRQIISRSIVLGLAPLVLLGAAGLDTWFNDKSPLAIALHLLNLFLASLICHTELAMDRPKPQSLTEYYILLSLGGNLGGIFNAIVAPLIFSTVVEYPLMLVAACMLWPARSTLSQTKAQRIGDWAWPAGLFVIIVAFGYLAPKLPESGEVTIGEIVERTALFGLPLIACLAFVRRPLRFALGVAAILSTRPIKDRFDHRLLHVERSFFGVHKVDIEQTGRFKRLLHGTTVHGMQQIDPRRACTQVTYYHETGPLGQIFSIRKNATESPHIAVIGLGTGTLAARRQSGQDFTFFEIDPAVKRIAEDPRFFSYLSDCSTKAGPPGGCKVVLGDGRLRLAEQPAGRFGLIVIDAFSSDSIPMHLLTREALAVYLDKLAPNGIIAFHVSSRLLDLPPVVARLARDAKVYAFAREDIQLEPVDGDDAVTIRQKEQALADGKTPSCVVAIVREPSDLKSLMGSADWRNITDWFPGRCWTDDSSNLFETIRWR